MLALSPERGRSPLAARLSIEVVERRKSTDPKVPIGTTESSPRFQPWVASREWPEPRPPSRRSGALARREGGRGDRKDGTGPVRSFVPDGTRFIFAPQPSDKSLGYFRASLRDVESRHAKHVPSLRGGEGEEHSATLTSCDGHRHSRRRTLNTCGPGWSAAGRGGFKRRPVRAGEFA